MYLVGCNNIFVLWFFNFCWLKVFVLLLFVGDICVFDGFCYFLNVFILNIEDRFSMVLKLEC